MGWFLRTNAGYLLLAPCMVAVGTTVHELAHIVSVFAEGGTVLSYEVGELRWIPSVDANRPLIAFAPTLVWTGVAASTALLSVKFLGRDAPSRVTLLLAFFLPLADASFAVAGLSLRVPRADWASVCGDAPAVGVVAFALYVALLGEVGLHLFRRCWGRDALSAWEYSAMYLVGLAVPWLWYAV